jgi:putative two-component system response regulator
MTTPRDTVRVLVVDDETLVRDSLIEALSWIGYEADGASSVEDAIELLHANAYSIVFCDLVMPDTDGFTLLEIMRRKYPHMPVIVLTGHATLDLTQRAIRLGAQDFLVKPFSIRELPFVVERNMERVRLEAQLREQRVEELLFQTVQALSAAIEAKDPYTAGHSQKVAYLAMQFAHALNLSNTDIFALRLAGMMHDVGKIGIPETVLLKPGKLSEAEWEIMKQHPVIGAEIVGEITDLDYIAKVVRAHHERWDGSGYPDALRAEAIPFLARILYLSDAFEALTADRAYRAGLSDDEAMAIIRSESGQHFDTELVRVLEYAILPSISSEWRTPSRVNPHLTRTTHDAMMVQAAYQSGEGG